MRAFFCVVAVVVCLVPCGRAADADAARELVRQAVDEVVALIADEELEPGVRRARILEVVGEAFDFELMAKLTLGRTHWGAMDAAQREAFTELFIRQLEDSYYDKSNMLLDQEITVGPAEAGRGGRFQVATQVVPKAGDPLDVVYRVHAQGRVPKVYDVEIDGISLVRSFRSQYDQIIRAEGIEALLVKLRERVLNAPVVE